jgi:uncharacterized membrane protein HdeD (DUF308 family)
VAGLAELRTPGAGFMIANGVVSLVLGLLIAAELPSAADWAIGLLVGIDFIFYGAAALGLAWQLGRGEGAPGGDPAAAPPAARPATK